MNDILRLVPSLRDDLDEVRRLIWKHASHPDETVTAGLHSLLSGEGKMLRPAMLLISARFGSYDRGRTFPLAAAAEMLHVSTLIHDDVIDDSPLRRGLPTLHTRYGKREAVLMGDYLLSRCFVIASDRASPEIAKRLARVVDAICSSEIGQSHRRFKPSASIRSYLRTIAGKTAALFALSCHVGAAENGCSPDRTQTLRRVGYDIGMAFQIVDDVLDYEGEPGVLRKPTGRDIREGVCTLPMVHALRADDGRLAAAFRPRRYSDEEVASIAELVRERGGIAKAEADALRFTERALRGIGTLPPSANRDDLSRLAESLTARRS